VLFVLHAGKKENLGSLVKRYPYSSLFFYTCLAFIPTAILGYAGAELFEFLFRSVTAVGLGWIVIGSALLASRCMVSSSRALDRMRYRDALFIGSAQAFAIAPGISRSGATMIAGMMCGLSREDAAKFSFWIAPIVILGATVFKLQDGVELFWDHPVALLAGLVSSAFVGFFAIGLFLKMVQQEKLFVFGYYCLFLGIGTTIYGFLSGTS